MRGRGRGRGRAARGRRGGITRGRAKKNMKVIESDEDEPQQSETQQPASQLTGSQEAAQSQSAGQQDSQPDSQTPAQDENLPPTIDLEADISQLEAPTFTTLNRGPPEPMLHLRWDHKVSLIGEKVLNPMIHSCDQCNKPILIYGRMIPCKHVFCLSCARKEDKACPRCMDPVSRVEQTNLGTVFMCTHGGSRYGSTGCRRTYLSQRDLQAHINHRHSVSGGDASPKVSGVPAQPPPQPQQQQQQQPPPRKIIPPSTPPNDPRAESGVGYRAPPRTNLITVPIQQEPPPPPPPPPQQPPYHPQTGGVTPNTGGYPAPPPPPPPPVQYGAGGYPSGYYQAAPSASYPPPQYPPPPPPDQPPQQYWQHPPPMHQFYR